MLKLALAQMRVEGGAKAANLARAETAIGQAREQGAEVVLLPETLNLGWTHGAAATAADEIPAGESCTRLRTAAKANGVYVCAGLVERAGGVIFNSAVLIDPRGEVVLHHRKLNELEIAHGLYAQGDRLGVVATPFGTFGLMICADAFVPGQVVTRSLGVMGADVILSPCAWAVPADHDNDREPYGQLWLDHYSPVARDFRLWIAGCSNIGWISDGPWQGRKCIGCSLVVGPNGNPVLRGPYGVEAETILLLDMETEPLRARSGRRPGPP
ncbi:MAG TPA: carbon-nitrogen hydrolase family protein [Opitutaceae bacterium]|nr:carbon-nitrogen hydrolase family protein [Opitutaceae bacterium]